MPSQARITPNDNGAGGSFDPEYVELYQGQPTGSFRYTPTWPGAVTISFTNDAGLDNPPDMTYTGSEQPQQVVLSVTGPETGYVGVASDEFVVSAALAGPPAATVSYLNMTGPSAGAVGAASAAFNVTSGWTK